MKRVESEFKTICDIALKEIYSIEELSDIAETVISKLVRWTHADRMYADKALKELSELAEWVSDYDVREEE